MADQLLDKHADSVLRKALSEALKGDASLLRVFLPYILPRPKATPVKTGPLAVHTIAELEQTSEALLQRVAAGRLTPQEAAEISALLNDRRLTLETRDLYARVRAVEESLAKSELK